MRARQVRSLARIPHDYGSVGSSGRERAARVLQVLKLVGSRCAIALGEQQSRAKAVRVRTTNSGEMIVGGIKPPLWIGRVALALAGFGCGFSSHSRCSERSRRREALLVRESQEGNTVGSES